MPRLGLGSHLTGGALPESFVNSYSVEFDGSGDLVSGIGNGPTGNFTFSAWVKMTATNAQWNTVYSAGGSQIFIGLHSGYNQVGVHIGGSSIFVSAADAFPTDEWHHLVVTWDGSDVKNRVDTTVIQTQALSGVTITSAAANFGKNPVGTGYLTGIIDEASIWSVALSDAAIAAIYNGGTPLDVTANYSDNLVGYWRFEEGTGTSAADSSGNGNDGTVTNATWSTDVPG